MSVFADTARLIILNSFGSTAGTAVTGVVSFGMLNNPIVTVGITPFTFDFTFKAGI
jgi:energy-converting hydrogenase Eha subunit E